MEFRDSHPSDQELVLAADGELSARRLESLRKHVGSCWQCRVRAEDLEGVIRDFIHLHRRSLDPLLIPASGRRALLKAELDEISSSRVRSLRHLPQLFTWHRWVPITIGVGVLILGLASLVIPHQWFLRREPTMYTMYASFVPISFPATELTPGVARFATREQVCGSNEGKNRDVPIALRRKVFELYGMPGADPKAYEVDYLITPALGGADDIGNLWPQSYSATIWNARVKDALEDRLHDLVCSGYIDLATAQREIATDWIGAYRKYFHTDRPLN